MESDVKTIFITSFHVLVSRNILLSPLLKKLVASNWRVVLIIPKKKEEYIKKLFTDPRIIVAGVENKLNRFDDLMKDLALAALRTQALKTMRHRRMGIERPIMQRLFFAAPLIRSFIPIFYRMLMGRHSFHDLFERFQPSLLFSTDVFSSNDCRLLLEAKEHGVKTVGMVRSWDNLTTKGGFRVIPDTLVVQNEIARDEAVCFHGVDKKIIHTVGIPHYDNYLRAPTISRGNHLQGMGIPFDKKYFVYAPLGDRIMKVGNIIHKHGYDEGMIEILDELLPENFYLMVRFPPTDTVTIDSTRLSSRIIFYQPGLRFGEGIKGIRSSEMSSDDDESLFNTLYYAHGVINPFSSLCIDAAFLDRPIIVPTFDPKPSSYWESIRRVQEFEHFRIVLESDGVKVARDSKELSKYLIWYAQDPGRDKRGREVLTQKECFSRDGKSSERLFTELKL